MICRAVLLLSVIFVSYTAGAEELREPARVARDFAVAAMADDPAVAARFWSDGPERDAFLTRFEHARETRCRRLLDAVVTSIDVRDAAATALVDVDLAEWSTSGLFRRHRRAFRAELSNVAGAWRIAQWQPAEDWLALRIRDAASPQERREIVESAPESIRERLPGALAREGIRLLNRSRADDARALVALATDLANRSGDPAAQAHALASESVLLRDLQHEYTLAQALAARSVALAEESGDPDAIAAALLRYGRGERRFSRENAESALLRVLSIADSVDDSAIVALSATQLAQIHDNAGEYRSALRFAREAKRYAAISGDPAALISADMNVGGAYLQIGDVVMARPHYLAAIDAAKRAGFAMTAASVAFVLAQATGEDVDELANELLRSGDPNLMRLQRAELLLRKAQACADRNDDAAAEDAIHDAMRLLLPGDPQGNLWRMVADIRFRQGRYAEAASLLDATRETVTPTVFMASSTARLKAATLRATGDREEAIAVLEGEIDWFERTLAAVPFSSRQLRLAVQRDRNLHESLVWLQFEAGHIEEALAVADAFKARVLRTLAQGSRLDVLAPSESVEKAEAEQAVTRINRALRTARTEDAAAIAHLQDELTRARTELQRLDMFAQPAPAASLRASSGGSVFNTAPDAVGVEYVVSDHATLLFTFGGSGTHARIRCHRIEVSRAELTSSVRRLVQSLEERDPGWRPHAERLYALLLRPAAAELAAAHKLIVVPQGPLWGVPFHALVDDAGHALIDRMAVEYRLAMSLGQRPARDRRRSEEVLLAFANPVRESERARERNLSPADIARSLPDAETEAKALRQLYGGAHTRVYVGEEAQESRFKMEGPGARILHIATHAFADSAWPMYSALLFARPGGDDAEDGILEAREIAAMQLSAEVAVLSACETGRGEYDWDEGVVGLPWAFLAAGTPAVVVSQWKVASQSTAQLMIEFHARLRRPGTTPAEALRGAQRALRARARYAHPFYWAPFVTITGK